MGAETPRRPGANLRAGSTRRLRPAVRLGSVGNAKGDRSVNLLDKIRINLGGIMLVIVFIVSAYACLFTDVSIGRIVGFVAVGFACAFSTLFLG